MEITIKDSGMALEDVELMKELLDEFYQDDFSISLTSNKIIYRNR